MPYIAPHLRGRGCTVEPEDSNIVVGVHILHPDGRFLLVQGIQYLTDIVKNPPRLHDYIRERQSMPIELAPSKEDAIARFLQERLPEVRRATGLRDAFVASVVCKEGTRWSARFAVPRAKWGFLKGAVKLGGEAPITAARRETLEELGYIVSQKYDALTDLGEGLFQLQLQPSEVERLEAGWVSKWSSGYHEIASIRWVTRGDAARMRDLNVQSREWLSHLDSRPLSRASDASSQSYRSLRGGGRRRRTKKVKRHVVPTKHSSMLRRTKKT